MNWISYAIMLVFVLIFYFFGAVYRDAVNKDAETINKKPVETSSEKPTETDPEKSTKEQMSPRDSRVDWRGRIRGVRVRGTRSRLPLFSVNPIKKCCCVGQLSEAEEVCAETLGTSGDKRLTYAF